MKNIPLYDVRPINDIKHLLETSTELYSERTAFWVKKKGVDVFDKYQPITYREYKEDVSALGTALLSLGLKGKRIAVIGESRYEWVVTYMAVVCGVGIIVPLDKELPENEIESLLIRSKVDAIIYSGNSRNHISNIAGRIDFVQHYIDMDSHEEEDNKDANGNTKILSYNDLLEKGRTTLLSGNKEFDELTIDSKVMNVLLFTSATTDKSKAVMLSQNNISKNLTAMCTMVNIVPDDVFLSILPLHHTYENTCGFLCPLYRGASIAFCEGLRHIPKNLKESKATVMLGVPLIFEAIYRRIWDQAAKSGADKKLRKGIKISNLLRKFGIDITKKLFSIIHDNFGGNIRLFISGAAGIDPKVARGFRELGILCLQGYGLTESSPIVALNRDVDFRDNSAGLPLPGIEVKIVETNSDGIGEIVVKGESVMLGYYENDEETKKILKDGWFYTGDLGYMDNDNFIYITGRKKNVIVTKNGKNIYPEEIEAILAESPYVLESIVFGKQEEGKDEFHVFATIVPDMEVFKNENEGRDPSAEEIRTTIQKEIKATNKGLVLYKHIKEFDIRMEEFAKTTSKKIKRYQN